MSKIKTNPNSKFDPKRAMELANLIERAYQQFNHTKDRETRDQPWEPEVSHELIGSTNSDLEI